MSRMSLGEDLETEILVRLPAKSLIRFKCVQQSWNVLFKTATFVTRHMHMHMSEDRLMILYYQKCNRFKPRIKLLSCVDPTPTPPLIKSLFPESCPVCVLFNGHYNGVFCLSGYCGFNHSPLILWNPTTREVHHIPPPPSPHLPRQLRGFGADPNTNDFKVVNLSLCFHNRKENYLSSAEVYNLNTKSWTVIHRPVLPHPTILPSLWSSKFNAHVNGVYHWITGYTDDGVANILCFDFRNNQFRELRGPISLWESAQVAIAEVNGSLAYVVEYQYDGPVRLGIWVMDQQGWAKKYSIGPFEPMVHICGIWKDGAQVLGGNVGQPLMSYDHDCNSVRQFQVDVECGCYFSIHDYVQSIAPLST